MEGKRSGGRKREGEKREQKERWKEDGRGEVESSFFALGSKRKVGAYVLGQINFP